MKRLMVFVVLLLAFGIWTFPHRQIVERMIRRRTVGLQADVSIGSVKPTMWPPGYLVDELRVRGEGYGLELDAVRLQLAIGPGSAFQADACGGSIAGTVNEARDRERETNMVLEFSAIDPSGCLDLGPVELSGSFDGSLELQGVGAGPRSAVLGRAARAGRLRITARNGTVSGHLPRTPGATSETVAAARPLGSWEFANASLEARIDGSSVVIEAASAEAEGVRWEIPRARLEAAPKTRTRINLDLRARALDESPRAKAMLGLLPRASDGTDGWRRYRITGTLDSPKIVGLK